jgi:hypothetical protein
MRYWFLSLLLLAACTSSDKPAPGSRRTVILFLIDGLSKDFLSRQIERRQLPNLENFFLRSGGSIGSAHAVFPSDTFPNVASLLREQPVHKSGAIGNTIVVEGKVIHFEDIWDRKYFSRLMGDNNVFNRLEAKGLETVSLDYGLGVDASRKEQMVDIGDGLALRFQDYLALDKKRIESLEKILNQDNTTWPAFIFVHLIGVDFTTHKYGKDSKEAREYLSALDSGLKDVFLRLQSIERRHKVVTFLTADHGFASSITNRVNIQSEIRKADPELMYIAQPRSAALYYPKTPSVPQLDKWIKKFQKIRGIELVAYRSGDIVKIASKTTELIFSYKIVKGCQVETLGIAVFGLVACPSDLPPNLRNSFHPFLVENLAYYFQAEKHPDMLILPDRHTSFTKEEQASHGGPTEEETVVPLLVRNAYIKSSRIPALWQLLQFM